MGLFVLPGQRRIDASRRQPVELVFNQLAQLHGIAPVANVGRQDGRVATKTIHATGARSAGCTP